MRRFSISILTVWPLLTSIVALILYALIGQINVFVSLFALFVGLAWAYHWSRQLHSSGKPCLDFKDPHFLLEVLLIGFVFFVGLKSFTWLLYHYDHGLWTLAVNNIGDLPMHIHFIRSFSGGLEFPPLNPLFSSELLRYAYGPDLFNALFEKIGMPTQGHLLLTGMIACVTSLIALRRYAGWLGILGFFLSGSWAYWPWLGNGLVESDMGWRNLFQTVFLTQRGLMFSLPIGILILHSLNQISDGEQKTSQCRLRICAWLLGFMAFFHLHSFVAISALVAGKAFVLRRKTDLREWFHFALRVFLASGYFIFHSTDGFKRASIVHFRPNWTFNGNTSLVWYYFSNFGPWLLLFLIAAGLFLWRRQMYAKFRFDFFYGALLFLFFLNVMFAPWEWDNIKCLIWPYLFLLRAIYCSFDSLLNFEARWVLATLLSFSGFQGLQKLYLQSPTRGQKLYSMTDLANAAGAGKELDLPHIRLLTASTYAHVATWFGWPRVVGYRGHLWSHAIPGWEKRADMVDRIYKGDADWRTMVKDLGATHIYWGPDERGEYGELMQEWRDELKNVSRVTEHGIYQID